MAIYTVGRRRVIVVLLLTSALLLTLDLRGSAVLDRARDAFSFVMQPIEDAAEVATSPIERLWNAYNDYDDLEQENVALRERLDEIEGSLAAAEASVIDYNALLALQNLPSLSSYSTEVAEVVGRSSNNIDQLVEINKGSLDGVAIGMPVVNRAGLVGRITTVNLSTSQVMLVTDPRFVVPVEVLAGTGSLADDETVTTTPSGRTFDEIDGLTDDEQEADGATATDGDVAPGSTTPLDVLGDERFPLPQAGDENAEGSESDPVVTTSTTTTTSILPPAVPADGSPIPTTTLAPTTTEAAPVLDDEVTKEFGALEGQGRSQLPQIRFVQDTPSLTTLHEGDLVQTAGGDDSLAPPDIPVGRVINRADRPGVAGPLLEVELLADLDQLSFVRVVLFRPATELGQ